MPKTKERPILFSGPMVRAIIEGRKMVTRRAIKHQPDVPVTDAIPKREYPHGPATVDWYWRPKHGHLNGMPSNGWDFKCPYGQPGDRLWVRETHKISTGKVGDSQACVRYQADGDYQAKVMPQPETAGPRTFDRTRPSIHMPRWASRILLAITDVRVERLQDISEQQALAEGIVGVDFRPDDGFPICRGYMVGPDDGSTPLETHASKAFAGLWRSINGSESWGANPWVWVVEFKRIES